MFQRKNAGGLPTTLPGGAAPNNPTAFGVPLGRSNYGPDGSGKAIKMDAPIVKSWKQASGYTKYSYYILGFFVFLIYIGYRYMSASNASVWLTCHLQECTLDIKPPNSRKVSVTFPRAQLHSAQQIKTDKAGNFLYVDTSRYEPPQRGKGKKKYKASTYKGPDEKGEYQSYSLKFRNKSPPKGEQAESTGEEEESVGDVDFSKLSDFMEFQEDDDEGNGGGLHVMHMRKFGFAQSKTRIRSMVNKVESYVKNRRQKIILKETAPLPWQGILCLILGLLGLMMTLLIGQFWDEPPKRQGGPGARRGATPARKASNQRPTFVVDTGRPSKYPPGYKKY